MNPGIAPFLIGCIALLAVLVALRGIAAVARASTVGARLARLYWLVAALLGGRLIVEIAGGFAATLAVVAVMLIAAWLPLAGLRLAEELTRRHAPRLVKLAALLGAIAFTAIGVTVGFVWSAAALIALAIFQAVMLAATVALLLTRKEGLARAERATADTFLIALLLTVPLALTDFRVLLPDTPLRGGSFAVLVLVLATSRLISGDARPRRLLGDIALCLGGSGIVALATGGDIASAGLGFALTALALLVERFARGHQAKEDLVAAFARAKTDNAESLLASHPLLAEGRIVEGPALADYPSAAIAALARHFVVSDATLDPEVRDAARDLLDAHAATHLVRLSAGPPRFLAVSAGSFATARTSDALTVLAQLVEART